LQDLSDRALKERVVGAAVLVILAVLVVPIFLDGPSSEPEIVSESVTLPGQNNQERKQQTIVLDRDRSEPVPVSRPAEPAARPESSEKDAPAAAAQKPEPDTAPPAAAPVEKAVAGAPAESESGTGMWAVQLGSFSNRENAEKLAAELRDRGYAAFLSQLGTDGGQLQRVRVGPQKDRESAEAVAAQLAKSGHPGQVVPHP